MTTKQDSSSGRSLDPHPKLRPTLPPPSSFENTNSNNNSDTLTQPPASPNHSQPLLEHRDDHPDTAAADSLGQLLQNQRDALLEQHALLERAAARLQAERAVWHTRQQENQQLLQLHRKLMRQNEASLAMWRATAAPRTQQEQIRYNNQPQPQQDHDGTTVELVAKTHQQQFHKTPPHSNQTATTVATSATSVAATSAFVPAAATAAPHNSSSSNGLCSSSTMEDSPSVAQTLASSDQMKERRRLTFGEGGANKAFSPLAHPSNDQSPSAANAAHDDLTQDSTQTMDLSPPQHHDDAKHDNGTAQAEKGGGAEPSSLTKDASSPVEEPQCDDEEEEPPAKQNNNSTELVDDPFAKFERFVTVAKPAAKPAPHSCSSAKGRNISKVTKHRTSRSSTSPPPLSPSHSTQTMDATPEEEQRRRTSTSKRRLEEPSPSSPPSPAKSTQTMDADDDTVSSFHNKEKEVQGTSSRNPTHSSQPMNRQQSSSAAPSNNSKSNSSAANPSDVAAAAALSTAGESSSLGKSSNPPLANSTNSSGKENPAAPNKGGNHNNRGSGGWISNQPARTFINELEQRGPATASSTATTKTTTAESSTWKTARRHRNTKSKSGASTRPGRSVSRDAIWDDSQDSRPPQQEPEYAYQETVRCQKKRRGLPCYTCAECRVFYGALRKTGHDVPDEFLEDDDEDHDPDNHGAAQHHGRHRARYQPNETPTDFWELDFLDEREAAAQEKKNKRKAAAADVYDTDDGEEDGSSPSDKKLKAQIVP